MRRAFLIVVLSAFCLNLLLSCKTKNDGAVEGLVVPPCPGVRITFTQAGKTICAADADVRDGKFRTALAPGKYDISVRSSASPFPVTLTGITVEPGKTSTLAPIEMSQSSGTAVISGSVSPGGPGTRVTLLTEGRERASVAASPDGRYEFTALPAGEYTLEASSPGYASDSVKIRLSGDRRANENIRLLYISPIDGADWTRGVIRARGQGRYPANSQNPTTRREMARRAALSEAERNLLRAVMQVKLDPGHDLESAVPGSFTSRLRGYLQGFRVIDEHETSDGIEVELELPLTGPNGLTRYLVD